MLTTAGVDTLYGGAGADKFVFSELTSGANWDKIMDFNHAEGDSLVFDSNVFSSQIIISLNRLSNKKSIPSEYLKDPCFVFEQSTGKLYYDVDGIGVGKAPDLLAQLVGVKDLLFEDLHFI